MAINGNPSLEFKIKKPNAMLGFLFYRKISYVLAVVAFIKFWSRLVTWFKSHVIFDKCQVVIKRGFHCNHSRHSTTPVLSTYYQNSVVHYFMTTKNCLVFFLQHARMVSLKSLKTPYRFQCLPYVLLHTCLLHLRS